MRSTFVALLAFALCSIVCMGAEGKVVLTKSKALSRKIPTAVVPNDDGSTIKLSNLSVEEKFGRAKATVDFKNASMGSDFTLVVFISTGEDMVVCYFDPENSFYISNQSDEWTQRFDPGFRFSTKRDKISFYIPRKVAIPGKLGMKTVYDISGKKTKIMVFSVSGHMKFMSAMPGNQKDKTTFHSNSNLCRGTYTF